MLIECVRSKFPRSSGAQCRVLLGRRLRDHVPAPEEIKRLDKKCDRNPHVDRRLQSPAPAPEERYRRGAI